MLVLIVGLFGLGYRLNNLEKNASSKSSNETQSAVKGAIAPNFKATTLTGQNIDLESYKGKKPVVLDFFATWCPNCRRSIPNLSRLYQKYQDQIEVIGVNLQEQEGVVREFVQSAAVAFPIILDPDGRVTQDYGVIYTNYHVIIDKEGKIFSTIPGDISEEDIQSVVN